LALQTRGSYWVIADSVKYNFSADAQNLYLFDNAGTWVDISKPATVYSAGYWDFINFQRRVIATDGGSGALQYYDVGVSSTFLDLPGSPPKAKVLAVVRDFVVLGNYEIGSEVERGGIAWSGFNNTEIWTPAIATQCGRRRTRGAGGDVTRIIGGTQGMVFRDSAIVTMRYVGPSQIWQWDDITTLHGTPAGKSVSWSKDLAFYYSQDGFNQIDRRTLAITPIGTNAVNEWFRSNCAPAEIVNMIGATDRARNLVWWAFRSSSSSVPFNRILVYDYVNRRFAYAELDVEWLGEFVAAGYNLDTIGAVLGGNIDSASINVDSTLYAGGALSFIGFDSVHKAGNFTGTPLVAEIDTTEIEPNETGRSFINGIKPAVEGSAASMVQIAPLTRNSLLDAPVLGSYATVNPITGQADMRVNARYMRYRVKIAGGFTQATRVSLSVKTRGRR
jgi:hypothetical protein